MRSVHARFIDAGGDGTGRPEGSPYVESLRGDGLFLTRPPGTADCGKEAGEARTMTEKQRTMTEKQRTMTEKAEKVRIHFSQKHSSVTLHGQILRSVLIRIIIRE